MSGRYVVQTFGCQMNVHDSDRMEETLRAHGWSPSDDVESADLVVFNTCSVRERAEQKLRSEAGKLAPLKARRPDLCVAVAGCVAQQEGEKILARMPYVDIVIGPDNIAELPALVLDHASGGVRIARTVFDLDAPRFLAAEPRGGEAPVSAFVTTMKGCDERCSFCIVPTTRGPERYRPSSEIVAEVARWVAAGAREVTLLGQTVDSFRDPELPPPASDDPDESQFPELLRAIARDVPGLVRLRYTSPHPRHATASLVAAHRDLGVLARHVHMPVQSGSNRMLRRMIRRYTREEYVARVFALRDARASQGEPLTLSTDVIVGFPGETEEDFEATLSLIREVDFTQVFAFKYSPRPGTPALKLGDDVSEEEKSSRLARLFELTEELGRAHLAGLVGTTQKVLLHGASKGKNGTFEGRTEQSFIVHVEVPEGLSPIGEVVEVTVDRAYKHSLAGSPTADALSRLRAVPPRKAPEKRRRLLPLAPEGH
ncbi:MAG: tRNA (N6-isopentenyl adenosine(37)-C2)-methylthiotransferase MiaB [Polyangiaceae bacterium]